MNNLEQNMENLHIDPPVSHNRQPPNFLNVTYTQNFADFIDQHPNSAGVFITSCPNERSAIDMLTRIAFNLKFIQIRSAFMIVVEIGKWMNEFNAQDVARLMSILPKRSFLISFESLEDRIVRSYWKCRDGQIFSMNYSNRISRFVLDFLALSIQYFNPVNYLLHFEDPREICEVMLKDLTDFNNQNLLMIAAGRGDADAVGILLQEGLDVNYSTLGQLAIDFAWNNGHQNIVLMLLKDNSMFPKNLNVYAAIPEVSNLIEFTEKLHTSIIINDFNYVVTLLNENVNLQYYFGTDNISALARAMMNNNVQITNLLMSRNARLGPNERSLIDDDGFFRVEIIEN